VGAGWACRAGKVLAKPTITTAATTKCSAINAPALAPSASHDGPITETARAVELRYDQCSRATEVAHVDDPDAPWQARLRRALMTTLTLFQSHPWLGPLALDRIVPAPGYLRAVEILLDTVRTAGYGPRATVDVVEFAIESVSAMAARTAEVAKNPQDPSQDQLAMRQHLLDLSRADYPRIREAAKPLTSPGNPGSYVKNGIDVLIGGIEAAAPRRSGSTPRS
jgi:Tetracyclin repressor-like, C-terminal domain